MENTKGVAEGASIPPPSPLLKKAFLLYIRRYMQRHFHAIHLQGKVPEVYQDGVTPLLVCLNHSSWWDLLMGAWAEQLITGFESYAAMDAIQLQRYPMFRRMGVIGVDRTSLAGARAFLQQTTCLLHRQPRALWITPQGTMQNLYQRPLRFQPGAARLAFNLNRCSVLCLAIHYEFWNERLPEAFLAFGEPEVAVLTAPKEEKQFAEHTEKKLEALLNQLQQAAAQRDAALFTPLLRGGAGVAPLYDLWCKLNARQSRQPWLPEHGALHTPTWREQKTDAANAQQGELLQKQKSEPPG